MSKSQVDQHLKKFEKSQRLILQTLREAISAELPTATEVIKYGIPTFLIHGVPVLGYDGYKNHNSIFPYGGAAVGQLKTEHSNYEQTRGSIHFAIDKTFPKSLLKKIIKLKVQYINSVYPKKTGEFLEFYGNGVLKASGKIKGNQMHGDWKWFRKDGVIMRSGSFKSGEQIGVWITYDQKGKVFKKTNFGA